MLTVTVELRGLPGKGVDSKFGYSKVHKRNDKDKLNRTHEKARSYHSQAPSQVLNIRGKLNAGRNTGQHDIHRPPRIVFPRRQRTECCSPYSLLAASHGDVLSSRAIELTAMGGGILPGYQWATRRSLTHFTTVVDPLEEELGTVRSNAADSRVIVTTP